jgi:hypothetical protein
MKTLTTAVLAFAGSTAIANAGGILMCDEFHCRSVVEFPPPIFLQIPALPPVLSTHRPIYTLPGPAPRLRSGPIDPPPLASVQPPPQRRSRPDVQVPPPDARAETDAAEAKGIEDDIEGFCDKSPDEPFCSRLGKWLREHPRVK